MCGRFVLFTTSDALLHAAADITPYGELLAPHSTPTERYNIAPTQKIVIVRPATSEESADPQGAAVLEPARWGLFPHWKKDDSGPSLFNARAETVAQKPSFRDAFKKTRCIIPMDGYYEWQTQGKTKTPYFVHRPAESGAGAENDAQTGPLMWAAGLYSTGLGQVSATIVTTDSKEPIDWLHHRMPRFLAPDEVAQWLEGDAEEAEELLAPTPESLRSTFVTTEVDSRVGNVRNDFPELLAPVGRLL
ncbi:MAG: SOS response-associated peptidase [Corynebacterium glucuronolyticum]|nr:SOS response-associated peptidase [Mycobacteriaceae bacterium]MDY5833482.1 SOS response-associated peptidase [Corynebacterium glucuronolyticum]